MLSAIKTLPTEVVNQIAAGEVVERPANMLKELIENSLDAGASKVEIHFSEGGRYVQIKDNGCGIAKSDLPLALSPHSTSKIASLADIWAIGSYGFRGEALSAIAEVSDLTLISRPASEQRAGCLKSEFGKKSSVMSMNAEKGTTVIVKKLFQHTPVRLKFLKSESAETFAIKNTLKAMALSRPEVEFRVLHKNKLLFYWPKTSNLQKRAEQILSLQNPFYTKTQYQDVNVEAVLCAPNETVSNRKHIWFFVEGRWVEDSTLYSAVMSAYRGLLMHGEYPVVVLRLSCKKEDLDVNVHPAKSRLKFKNSSLIFKAVNHSLRAVLEKAPWINNQKSLHQKEQELSFAGQAFDKTHFQGKHFHTQAHRPAGEGATPPSPGGATGGRGATPPFYTEGARGFGADPDFSKNAQSSSLVSAIKDMEPKDMDPAEQVSPPQPDETKTAGYWSSLHILSQAHLTYILAQTRHAVVFIDQHAAHERVLYERLMLSWNTGKGEVQNRLVPLALDMEESLVTALLTVQKDLLKIGVKLEGAGPQSLVVHSAPAILKDVALQNALMKLAEEIQSLGGGFAMEKKISDLCASMACHSAVRAGQSLSTEEMKELLTQMDEFPLSGFCPHGRPVFVNYPLSRLEKDFGRRV